MTQATSSERTRAQLESPTLDVPLLIVCGVLITIGCVLAGFRLPAPDIAWPLYLARETLAGFRLVVDFQEVNPPLVVWLSVVPVLLGKATGFSDWTMTVVLLGWLMAASLTVMIRLMPSLFPTASRAERRLFVVLATFAIALLPRYDFAEREHLALLLVWPYVLLAAVHAARHNDAPRSPSRHEPTHVLSLVAGVLAGLGFALKPYFLVAWLLIEWYLAARRGVGILRRRESVMVVVTCVAYLLSVAVFVPGYTRMALALRPVYQSYLSNPLHYLLAPEPLASLPMFACIVYVADRSRGTREPLRDVLALGTLGFWISALLQGKGLGYHYLPAMAFGFLLMADIAIRSLRPKDISPSAFLVMGTKVVALVIPLVLGGQLIVDALERRKPPYLDAHVPLLLPYVQRAAAMHRKVAVLSSNPASAWPLVYEGGASWGLRYMSLWMLAGFYWDQLVDGKVAQFRPWSERSALERAFSQNIVDDLTRSQPAVLIVLNVDGAYLNSAGETQLDYLAYFSIDPRFQPFMRAYQEKARVGRYTIFERR